MSDPDSIFMLLERAHGFALTGQDEAAKAAYLAVLHRDPTHFDALNELGNLAMLTGHRSAARSVYQQAVQCHPDNPVGRVNYGHLLYQNGEVAEARAQYEAALAVDPGFAEAHQGLARALTAEGEADAAEAHWRQGFAGRAMMTLRFRGMTAPVRVLLLVSVKDGNIPTQRLLDDRVFAVTALHAEFYDPAQDLPAHDLVFNAIGDADLCATALTQAAAVVARSRAPVINPPDRVMPTGRAENATRLGRLPEIIAPRIRTMSRSALAGADGLSFPLLLRAPGFHTGRHFLRVERSAELAAALAALPGDELLVLDYLDARGADGKSRKYRAMIIDGALYPLHLAISTEWKVHYFSADMARDAAYRAEEQRFLEDMPRVLGDPAMAALAEIGRCLGLDYAGVDFGLAGDGRLLLFEANATMVVHPPDADPMWDYRRAPIARVLAAAQRMLLARANAKDVQPLFRG